MNEQEITSKSIKDTELLAQKIAKRIQAGGVLLLKGDLGSGKTTFTQLLAKSLGITRRISSPTFIIMRTYPLEDRHFYHLDLYRTESVRDIEGLGVEEVLQNPHNIVVIEWPEKLGELTPKNALTLEFTYLDDTTREIKIYEN